VDTLPPNETRRLLSERLDGLLIDIDTDALDDEEDEHRTGLERLANQVR
jgi:hypothetical protein